MSDERPTTPEERATDLCACLRCEGYVVGTTLAFRLACAIREAVAAEREACARLAETLPFSDYQLDDCRSDDIAAAIRKRSQP